MQHRYFEKLILLNGHRCIVTGILVKVLIITISMGYNKDKYTEGEQRVKKLYFFCDSQKNILTAYFMLRIYYRNSKEVESFLLVSNNSSKSTACAKRAQALGIWDHVNIIKEAFQNEEELVKISEEYCLDNSDEVYIFSLLNRFARVLYQRAFDASAQIKIIDEGVRVFNDFLKWQKQNPGEMYAGIDVKNIDMEGWCYEPRLYHLPSNIDMHRIELVETLHDDVYREQLQNEVCKIFAIEESEEAEVIYFDQYFTLYARTTGVTERYLIQKVASICGEERMMIKPHPMERGFSGKYDGVGSKIMASQDSPWEAIYFVNFYKKSDHKIICLSGESTSLTAPLIMFEDKNYVSIFLWHIYRHYIKPIDWNVEDYFQQFGKLAEENNLNFYVPGTFVELKGIMDRLLNEVRENDKMLEDIDSNLIYGLNDKLLQVRPPVCLSVLEVWDNDICVTSIGAEEIIIDGIFSAMYSIPGEYQLPKYQFRWKPCTNCFLGIKNIELCITSEEGTIIYPQENLVCEYIMAEEDGYFVCQNPNPGYLLKFEPGQVSQIEIKGFWRFNFDENRIMDFTEQHFRAEKQKMQLETDNILAEKNRICAEAENKIKQLESERSELILEQKRFSEEAGMIQQMLQEEKEELQKEKEELQKANEEIQAERDSIYESRSWKLTKPLRSINKVIKRQ